MSQILEKMMGLCKAVGFGGPQLWGKPKCWIQQEVEAHVFFWSGDSGDSGTSVFCKEKMYQLRASFTTETFLGWRYVHLYSSQRCWNVPKETGQKNQEEVGIGISIPVPWPRGEIFLGNWAALCGGSQQDPVASQGRVRENVSLCQRQRELHRFQAGPNAGTFRCRRLVHGVFVECDLQRREFHQPSWNQHFVAMRTWVVQRHSLRSWPLKVRQSVGKKS